MYTNITCEGLIIYIHIYYVLIINYCNITASQ